MTCSLLMLAVRASLCLTFLLATACRVETAGSAIVHCTPGSYRVCRCEDGTIGSQHCASNGHELTSCACGLADGGGQASSAKAQASGAGRGAAASGNAAAGRAATMTGNISAAAGRAASGTGTASTPAAASGKPGSSAVPDTNDTSSGAAVGGRPALEPEPVSAGEGGSGAASNAGSRAAPGAAGAPAPPMPGAGATPETRGEIVNEPIDAATKLFDDAVIHNFNIIIAPADLAKIDEHPNYEESVQGGLEFDGKSYGPYRVRYKGAGGAFKPPCSDESGKKTGKCSLKLDFNDLDSKARFFGLKKLNLHSMNADAAMLRDRLGYRMFREMGIAAPRAVHARVSINGKSEGLYIAVEQIDGVFARSRFTEGGEGNVYKEIWPLHDGAATYASALETNETEANVQHMLNFRAAVQQSRAAAERFYNRDYVMRYLAVDRVTINDDGAVRMMCATPAQLTGANPGPYGNHNYYWYEEIQSGRMWLIPWDLDKNFDATSDVRIYPEWTASAACSCTEHPWYGSQIPATCDPVIKHFQSARSDYDRAVDAFLAGPFAKAHVDELLDRWVRQIRPHVSETAGQNGAPSLSAWETGVDDLRRIIADARKNRGLKY